jgi:hypothetical protein
MRRRFTIPLICVMAAVPWLWFKPPAPPPVQPAEFVSALSLHGKAAWFGGFSGIEISDDGQRFYLVTDRGHLMTGKLLRQEEQLIGMVDVSDQPLVDKNGNTREFPHTDAEGLALDAQGRLNVSFEHAQRILRYDTLESDAKWPSYTRAWRALPRNGGLELVAVDPAGTLYTIPEGVANGASEALVYRRFPDRKWDQPFTLPLDGRFVPVGGDFGPDGRFYLLERDVYPFGFRSRVRAMTVTDDGLDQIETLLETPLGRHGNLEGLAVWRDYNRRIRLTMVSDNNFLAPLRSEIVEYIILD